MVNSASMLVLTRKAGQSLQVGNTTVTLSTTQEGHAVINFRATEDVIGYIKESVDASRNPFAQDSANEISIGLATEDCVPIYESTYVKVLSAGIKRTKIGIEAPMSVYIRRGETLQDSPISKER